MFVSGSVELNSEPFADVNENERLPPPTSGAEPRMIRSTSGSALYMLQFAGALRPVLLAPIVTRNVGWSTTKLVWLAVTGVPGMITSNLTVTGAPATVPANGP